MPPGLLSTCPAPNRPGQRARRRDRRPGRRQQAGGLLLLRRQGRVAPGLSDQWRLRDEALTDPSRPLEDVVAGILEAVYQDPDRVRFSIRESLDQDPGDVAFEPEAGEVVNLRARRQAGEISDELDPAFVLLVLQSAVMSGTVFPADTKRMLGLEPGSPEHVAHMSEQLRRLVRRLADPPPDTGPVRGPAR